MKSSRKRTRTEAGLGNSSIDSPSSGSLGNSSRDSNSSGSVENSGRDSPSSGCLGNTNNDPHSAGYVDTNIVFSRPPAAVRKHFHFSLIY